MKKIITLMFCTVLLCSAFAQSNRRDWDNKRSNNNTVYRNDDYSISQRNMQIEKISRQYDWQIQQIGYNRSLSRREKKFAIKALQAQKAEQISRIYSRYNSRDLYGRRDNRNKGYKQNNRYNDYDHDNR